MPMSKMTRGPWDDPTGRGVFKICCSSPKRGRNQLTLLPEQEVLPEQEPAALASPEQAAFST